MHDDLPLAGHGGAAATRAVARAFHSSQTLAEAIPRLLEAMAAAHDFAVAMWWAREGEVLSFAGIWKALDAAVPEFEVESRGRTFRLGEGLPGRVWQRREPVFVGRFDGASLPRSLAASRTSIHSAAGFPLLAGGDVLGVVEFFSRREALEAAELDRTWAVATAHLGEFQERVEARRAQHASEAHRAAMLDAALDAIVSMDAHGRVTDWNSAAGRLFGYTREQALQRDMADLIVPPRLRAAHRRGLAHYLASGHGPILGKRLELTAVRLDGSEFPIELTVVRIAKEGDPEFTGYLRDLTARREAEEAARKQVEYRERVLGIVGHDLRNPLSAILLSAATLRRDPGLSPAQAARADQITASASRIDRIVGNLLDYTRAREGQLAVAPVPADAHAITRRAVDELRAGAPETDIELGCEGEARGVWDPDRLEQIVSNLVSNALKHGDQTSPVRVTSRGDGQGWELVVHNAGRPIDAALLPRLFEPFSQGERAGTVHHGLGLGLYIVRELVQAHGGGIRVESTAEHGTTFTVRLPGARTPERG